MNEVNYQTLKQFDTLFRGLSDAELKSVARIVSRKQAEAGSLIILEGDDCDELYLLEDGVVDVFRTLTIVTSRHDYGTKERTFRRLDGGSHCSFGEIALIGGGTRTATVKAVTTCSLLVIDGRDFMKLCKSQPNIGYIVTNNIALVLVDYLRKANDDVIKLTTALSLALSG